MKITIISPEFPNKGGFPLAPPILEYLGALTLKCKPDVELQLIDANREMISASGIDADLVGISIMTPTADWSYNFADRLRGRGIKVVMGGIHPSALPNEAIKHSDAVVIGEAESVWKDILEDTGRGRLQSLYRGGRIPLNGLPAPLKGALKGHYPFRAVFTARGCIHKCSFCSVRAFFGDTVRFRPVDEVARDVEESVGRIYYNGDDNIWGSNIERSIDLFKELSMGSRKWWFGQGDLVTVQKPRGEEMLKWAYRSGLRSVWVGYESEKDANLNYYRAASKQGSDRREAVKKIMDAGIEVVFFLILGGRNDGVEDFDNALELSDRMKITIHPVLLTPYPGTEIYDEYKQYMRQDVSWRFYDGVHAVFEHDDPSMSVENREERLLRLNRDLFTFKRILRRTFHINYRGFPVAHMIAFMKQIAMRKGFRKAYEKWKIAKPPGEVQRNA